MKTASVLLAIAGAAASANAGIILTGIVDGSGSSPKGIEVYVDSAADYTGWGVEVYANGNTTAFTSFGFSGVLAQGFYYITSTASDMIATYASANSGNTFAFGTFNQNGDDVFRLFDAANNTVDQYGDIGTDGSGEPWEYLDSYAYRTSGTGPDGGFDISNWTAPGPDFIDDNGGDDTLAPFGTYQIPTPGTVALAGIAGLAAARRRRA